MSRTGKIARLPRAIREQLNLRLDDGHPSKDLVDWLNTLPEVKQTLDQHFASRPISEQNLCEWKQGGFIDWQRARETSERITRLIEQAESLSNEDEDDAEPGPTLADHLATVLAAELAAEAQRLLAQTTDPAERWQHLRHALFELHLLRRTQWRATRSRIEAERWEIECEERERKENEESKRDALKEALQPIRDAERRPMLIQQYGGGEIGRQVADYILDMEHKYRIQRFTPQAPDFPPFLRKQAKSNQIKVNQT